jgi:hypothetical protein
LANGYDIDPELIRALAAGRTTRARGGRGEEPGILSHLLSRGSQYGMEGLEALGIPKKYFTDLLARKGMEAIGPPGAPTDVPPEATLRDILYPADPARGGGMAPEHFYPTLRDVPGIRKGPTRAFLGAGLEAGLGMAMDPLIWAMPMLAPLRGARIATRLLGPAARGTVGGPGGTAIRAHAPEIAQGLEAAMVSPGASRAVRSMAGLRGTPSEIAAQIRAGTPAARRAQGIAENIDRVRRWSGRAIHPAFMTSMGIGAYEGYHEAKDRLKQGDVEGAAEAAAHAVVAGGMVGMSGARLAGQGIARARARGEPAPRAPIVRPAEPGPLDTLPREVQAEAYDHSMTIAKEWSRRAMGDHPNRAEFEAAVPEHLRPFTKQLWDHTESAAIDIRGGKDFLRKMKDTYGDQGPTGETKIESPDNPNDFVIIQRYGPEGEVKIVGAADVHEGALRMIAGGRAMDSPITVGRVYDTLDALGVERNEILTTLGAGSRKRFAEALETTEAVYADLEGRARGVGGPEGVDREGVGRPGEAVPAPGIPEARGAVPPEAWEALRQRLQPQFAAEGRPAAEGVEGRPRTAPPFFSQLRKVVDAPKTQGAMPGEQWVKFLQGPKRDIKAAEMKWTGLDEFLKERRGKRVTKEEVQRYLDENQVEVTELVRGFDPASGVLTDTDVRHAQWQLPGAEPGTYRELVLTKPSALTQLPPGYRVVPSSEVPAHHRIFGQGYVVMGPVVGGGPGEGPYGSGRTRESAVRSALEAIREDAPEGRADFTGTHAFPEPNILAWVRFNERKGPKGERILFIEEIQSDWAAKGRREGFATATTRAELERLGRERDALTAEINEFDLTWGDTSVNSLRSVGAPESLVDRFARYQRDATRAELTEGVPRAPFVESTRDYVNLATKRMVKWAADEGYDRVAWTTGEQQIQRWENALRERVDRIEWEKTPEGVQLKGYKGPGGDVARVEEQPSGRFLVRDMMAGMERSNRTLRRHRQGNGGPDQEGSEPVGGDSGRVGGEEAGWDGGRSLQLGT